MNKCIKFNGIWYKQIPIIPEYVRCTLEESTRLEYESSPEGIASKLTKHELLDRLLKSLYAADSSFRKAYIREILKRMSH